MNCTDVYYLFSTDHATTFKENYVNLNQIISQIERLEFVLAFSAGYIANIAMIGRQ